MKVVLANYTGDRKNWGCQATSRSLELFLSKALADLAPQIVSVPLPASHDVDRLCQDAYGAKIRRIYADAAPSAADLDFVEALCRHRFGHHVNAVRDCDIVVFQGEGTIGAPVYFNDMRLYALPFLAVHRWAKPVLSLNQTLVAASDEDTAILVRLFGRFSLVALREAQSYRFARQIGLDDAILCPDFAFAGHGASQTPSDRPPGRYFCVSGSAALDAYDIDRYLALIRSISEAHRMRPVFMFSRRGDAIIAERAASLFPASAYTIVSGDSHPTIDDIIPVLAAAEFAIGGRYHTAVSALAAGTPAVLLPSNSYKSAGLGPMLGLELPVYDLAAEAAIHSAVARLVEQGPQLRASISASVAGARQTHDRLAGHLRKLVELYMHGSADRPAIDLGLQPPLDAMGAAEDCDSLHRKKSAQARNGASLLKRLELRARLSRPCYRQTIERTLHELP